MVKKIICDLCKIKCVLEMTKEDNKVLVKGNRCDRGFEVGENNINSNKDILVTLVRIKGSKHNILPVKTKEPVDKKLFIEISKALSRVYVSVPVKIGDTICKNILNTGVDIVAGKNILE